MVKTSNPISKKYPSKWKTLTQSPLKSKLSSETLSQLSLFLSGEVLDLLIEEKITKSNGEVVIKKYSKGNLLGKGGFAKVYEFTNLETTKTCAAKIVAKSSLTKHRSKQKVNENSLIKTFFVIITCTFILLLFFNLVHSFWFDE